MIRKALIALSLVSVAPLASAHAHLERSTPANNATLAAAPHALTVTFTEGVETALSKLEISSDTGFKAPLGTLTPVKGEANTYQVGLPALKAGKYHVQMHITSVDTHRVENSLDFVVR